MDHNPQCCNEVVWTAELCYCFVSLNTVIVQSSSQCFDATAGKYLTVCVLIPDQSLISYDFGVKRKEGIHVTS